MLKWHYLTQNNHAAPHDIKTDVMIDPNKIYLLKQNYLWLQNEKSTLIKFPLVCLINDYWLKKNAKKKTDNCA